MYTLLKVQKDKNPVKNPLIKKTRDNPSQLKTLLDTYNKIWQEANFLFKTNNILDMQLFSHHFFNKGPVQARQQENLDDNLKKLMTLKETIATFISELNKIPCVTAPARAKSYGSYEESKEPALDMQEYVKILKQQINLIFTKIETVMTSSAEPIDIIPMQKEFIKDQTRVNAFNQLSLKYSLLQHDFSNVIEEATKLMQAWTAYCHGGDLDMQQHKEQAGAIFKKLNGLNKSSAALETELNLPGYSFANLSSKRTKYSADEELDAMRIGIRQIGLRLEKEIKKLSSFLGSFPTGYIEGLDFSAKSNGLAPRA